MTLRLSLLINEKIILLSNLEEVKTTQNKEF